MTNPQSVDEGKVDVLAVMERAAKHMIASGFNTPMSIGYELAHAKDCITDLLDACTKIRKANSALERTEYMYEMFILLDRIGATP